MKVTINLPDGTTEKHDWTKKELEDFMIIAGPIGDSVGYKMVIRK